MTNTKTMEEAGYLEFVSMEESFSYISMNMKYVITIVIDSNNQWWWSKGKIFWLLANILRLVNVNKIR